MAVVKEDNVVAFKKLIIKEAIDRLKLIESKCINNIPADVLTNVVNRITTCYNDNCGLRTENVPMIGRDTIKLV